jgi:hypothetical protein
MPFRLQFKAVAGHDRETAARNIAASAGFPRVRSAKRSHPVAVVGGGPLLDLEAVRHWPGDVWAINSTADFLLDNGIDCAFITTDPYPLLKTTAAKRLLASHCDPSLFVGDVQVFDLHEESAPGVLGGSTTATRAPLLAIAMGYPGCVFFGCESSISGRTHIDRDCERTKANQIIVRANGKDWLTTPQLLLQAQELAWFIAHTDVFREECGGLLRAMLKDDQWSVVAVNKAMKDHLIEVNGDSGLYDEPYIRPKHALDCGLNAALPCDCWISEKEMA